MSQGNEVQHNAQQIERATAELRRALEQALKADFKCVSVRVPMQRGKLGNIRVIYEDER